MCDGFTLLPIFSPDIQPGLIYSVEKGINSSYTVSLYPNGIPAGDIVQTVVSCPERVIERHARVNLNLLGMAEASSDDSTVATLRLPTDPSRENNGVLLTRSTLTQAALNRLQARADSTISFMEHKYP